MDSASRSSPVTPKMHGPARQFAGDLGGREERHLDAFDPLDLAAIIARAARL
jgi:hypothetical protein